EFVSVGYRFPADLFDGHTNLQQVLESRRDEIVTSGRDARKAIALFLALPDNAQPQVPEKINLGLLHVAEKVAEMDHPHHVGFVEFDSPMCAKCRFHGGYDMKGAQSPTRKRGDCPCSRVGLCIAITLLPPWRSFR